LDIIAGVPEFLVTPLLMGPVCLLSQDRFEEPVRRCLPVALSSFFLLSKFPLSEAVLLSSCGIASRDISRDSSLSLDA